MLNSILIILLFLLLVSLIYNFKLNAEIKKLMSEMRKIRTPEDEKIKLQNQLDKWFLEEKLKLSEQLTEEEKTIQTKLRNYQTAAYMDIEDRVDEMREKSMERLIQLYEEARNSKLLELEKFADELMLKKEFMRGESEEFKEQVELLKKETDQWREKYAAAVRNYEELYKMQNEENIHRISFNLSEKIELEELNKAVAKLRNPMPFYKAIYDIYISSKINELVLRVVGRGRLSGIYKITHVDTGMCYVGQSVDIGNRWKQHARRGCGAVEATQNRLYPAIMDLGIENFIWEVVETTEDSSKLGEMEKYWQEFYKAKDFGYSIR